MSTTSMYFGGSDPGPTDSIPLYLSLLPEAKDPIPPPLIPLAARILLKRLVRLRVAIAYSFPPAESARAP
eukprot:CAMPEP_0167747486 /NCGR_PEP_ID=MMETSP0110_2-20121227/4311_1 /TAXON_ID=629695 /ORGANISM="Gymnochlora sp., Strain CCMP2014" /LENGTH=69 /DNA_ID=CAMNT_0007632399 /DNA_START=701 /DNA_END=907 /DNA_ORIENTATION=+